MTEGIAELMEGSRDQLMNNLHATDVWSLDKWFNYQPEWFEAEVRKNMNWGCIKMVMNDTEALTIILEMIDPYREEKKYCC